MMQTKAKFLMNHLYEVEPLCYSDMQRLLKSLIKTNQGYELKTTNFKNRKDHRGYWCTNLAQLRGRDLIERNDKTKLYKTTSKGLKYWDKPFSKFIPPKGHTETSWKKHLKECDERYEILRKEREMRNHWTYLAQKELLNKTIVRVRYMYPHELRKLGFSKNPVVFQLDDGNWIVPMMDDEGNDGGSLSTNNEVLPVLY